MTRFTDLFVISLLLILNTSCEKDFVEGYPAPPKQWDTVFPKSYLPAWPGSVWVYKDSHGDTFIKKSPHEYFLTFTHGYLPFDSVYLPKFDDKLIYEYSIAKEEVYMWPHNSHFLEPILDPSKKVGTTLFNQNAIIHTGFDKNTVFCRDSSMMVAGKMYHHVSGTLVASQWRNGSNFGFWPHTYNFYAPDIGLIKQAKGRTGGYELELINYYINH